MGNEEHKVYDYKNIDLYTDWIINNFRECFHKYGFIEHDNVRINSKVDPSVYFIGSTISVLKPYLVSEVIPDKGYYLVQRCIRTRNLSVIGSEEPLNWSSYFMSIGTLSSYKRINEIGREIWDYFTGYLNISPLDIRIRVSSKDRDLMSIWNEDKYCSCLEIDSKEEIYYKHRYGMEGVSGRNLNFALRQENSNEFKDIGNLIVIEKDNEKIAVELAFGVSTLISGIFSLQNSIQSSKICKYIHYECGQKTHLMDALVVVVHLIHEGLRPTASNTRGRLLRSYIRKLKQLCILLHCDIAEVCCKAQEYEQDEYGSSSNVRDILESYFAKF